MSDRDSVDAIGSWMHSDAVFVGVQWPSGETLSLVTDHWTSDPPQCLVIGLKSWYQSPTDHLTVSHPLLDFTQSLVDIGTTNYICLLHSLVFNIRIFVKVRLEWGLYSTKLIIFMSLPYSIVVLRCGKVKEGRGAADSPEGR